MASKGRCRRYTVEVLVETTVKIEVWAPSPSRAVGQAAAHSKGMAIRPPARDFQWGLAEVEPTEDEAQP